jgi:penicillin-binding protein 2B
MFFNAIHTRIRFCLLGIFIIFILIVIKVLQGSKIFLVTNDTNYVMEDLTGWSINEVRSYTNLLGIDLKTEGYGYVTSQSIPAGTSVTNDMELNITLEK